MKSIAEIVADYLGLDLTTVKTLANRAPTSYKRYLIPKKKGGDRVIHHPSKSTKALQYALLDLVLSQLPIHAAAAAYRRGAKSPIRTNAATHAEYAYSVRVDIKDFFPSIRPHDLLAAYAGAMRKAHVVEARALTEDDKEFLTNCLFVKIAKDKHFSLAIGAPSSPAISNIVMNEIDIQVSKFAATREAMYTRYADDFVFSTNERGDCAKFVGQLKKIFAETKSPSLKINTEKTVFMSRGTKRLVTGLLITPNRQISVGRANKRYIRKLLCDLKHSVLKPKEESYLQGYLAYVLDVEPDFYNRLALKYGGEVVNRALNGHAGRKHG
jgi:RNA-directed DNA polymerase